MMRIHLFEFNDLPWYPACLRRLQTDYLQFIANRGTPHRQLVPLLQRAMQRAGTQDILDLCSGSSGPWLRLQEEFQRLGKPVRITLTDRYPEPEALRSWPEEARRNARYLAQPVDARRVAPELKGMRTLFEGFHHFMPQDAARILQDALEQRAAIGVFEMAWKPPLAPLWWALSPLMGLVSFIVLTPFIRPRTWTRFFWTYILPVVPVATCWDGLVSMLRVYGLRDLDELVAPLRRSDYAWEAGIAATGVPLFEYIYLLGYPVAPS